MAIVVRCTCGKKLKFQDQHAGRRGKCSGCSALFTIRRPSASTPSRGAQTTLALQREKAPSAGAAARRRDAPDPDADAEEALPVLEYAPAPSEEVSDAPPFHRLGWWAVVVASAAAVIVFGVHLGLPLYRIVATSLREKPKHARVQKDLGTIHRRVGEWKASRNTPWVPQPPQFAELTKDLKDPFSGKPYVYGLSTQDQYYAYSVGPNGEDDDGKGDDIHRKVGDW
jgi:hypothetical protein